MRKEGGGGGRGRDDCTGKEGREGTRMPLRDSSGEFAVTSGRINLSTDHPIAGYCPLPVYSVRVFCGSFEPSIFRVLRQPSADECRGVDYSRHFLFRAGTMARSPRLANRPIIRRLECSVMTRDRGEIIKLNNILCNTITEVLRGISEGKLGSDDK